MGIGRELNKKKFLDVHRGLGHLETVHRRRVTKTRVSVFI